jgi:indolepyruvate ferredoxin oxidoreductase alpha subunit
MRGEAMQKLLSPTAGERHFLLGNEAVVRGALEAGAAVAATYPGTPSSEIGDTFHELAPHTDRYFFEYSANEKVAMEVAVGASVAGVRSFCFMKHVGVNVAADALMTLAYIGVNGGMVILSADDPGCHSSQNEQDNRFYARLGLLPMLEPASPQEVKDMMVRAFDLSEELSLPVLIRTTTRVNHMRGIVRFDELPQVKHKAEFKKEPFRFMCVPAVARTRRPVLLEKSKRAEELCEEANDLNTVTGGGKLGILTSGVSYNYVADAISDLGLEQRIKVARLGFTYPVPPKWMEAFLGSVERCLVVEESEPILENDAKAVAHTMGLDVEITGLSEGVLPRAGELGPDIAMAAIARFAGVAHEQHEAPEPPPLPKRPPNLCAGCPHRATFYAAKLVTGGDAHFNTDIGCYALGLLPPLSMGDILMSMGSSINTAAGYALATDKPSFAFIGDSTFFHSGMTGLVNAMHNQHNMVLVVMDNRTTAMTGHQPHPGVPMDGSGRKAPELSIDALCRATGVDFVETVDCFDLKATIDVFRRAVAHQGLSVVISRGACIFMDRSRLSKRPAFQVDTDVCRYCGICADTEGCSEAVSYESQSARALHRIQALGEGADAVKAPLPEKPPVAPCTAKCPAHVCVQSYATLVTAGKYREAAESVRERIPFPRTIARVCHRPCEEACTRQRMDGTVAINALKRFATDFEDTAKAKENLVARVARAAERGKKVAVIGAGPAGLTAAHDLRLRGYEVEVFEAAPVAGGMLALGIPEYRLPRDILASEIELIKAMGVEIHLDTEVGSDITIDELRDEGFDAVLVATGAWKGAKLGIPGEDALGVHDALAFLESANLGEPVVVGSKVVVIGGGDAALDAARVARRLGDAEVMIAYRRGREEMPASTDEVRMAEEEGIEIELLSGPVELVTDGDGKVCGVKLVKNELGEPDESGRRRPAPVEGSERVVECESVIVAIGQRADTTFVGGEAKRTRWSTLVADPVTGATSQPGVFAAGDVVTGPQTVIHAIAAGQRAAYGVDRYLADGRWVTAPPTGVELDEVDPASLRYEPTDVEAVEPTAMDERAVEERMEGFEEAELGYEERDALREAARCLVCGQCAKCRTCIDTFACPAIYIKDGVIQIDDTLCIGCGVCALLCPNNAIRPREEPVA